MRRADRPLGALRPRLHAARRTARPSAEPLQASLLEWYARNGRSWLPWRVVRNPYYTLVSEFMLQQTQVDRVVPKFAAFVRRFSDVAALAAASPADVVREWKGLGYNSRAIRLQRAAQAVMERHGGAMPSDASALRLLPGVGPYTAAAIRAFGFGLDDAAVDTNVRRVIQRCRFGVEFPVPAPAGEVDAQARALVPAGSGHDWNSALMDLGATVCTARAPKCARCPLRTACSASPIDSTELERLRKAAAKPSPASTLPFEQTRRYARGRIVDRLRELPAGHRVSLLDLHRELQPLLHGRSVDDLRELVTALEREGLVDGGPGGLALGD